MSGVLVQILAVFAMAAPAVGAAFVWLRRRSVRRGLDAGEQAEGFTRWFVGMALFKEHKPGSFFGDWLHKRRLDDQQRRADRVRKAAKRR